MNAAARRAAGAPLAAPSVPAPAELPGDPRLWLALLVCAAAALRLGGLTSAPPGINQDEALSAWNGWCLLKTGHALSGEAWPIFHCRNIGDFPTMLFFYLLVPFQAVAGLSVWSTRLPAALAGVFAVMSAWHVTRALFGTAVAAVAAFALAVAPWSVFLGHFGTGASLGPLHALLPLSALVAARILPGARAEGRGVRPGWALASGLLLGIGTYGFHSLRLQLPLTLAALALLFPRHWSAVLARPKAKLALVLLAAGFVATFAPMAWVSASDPDSLKRWEMTRLWPAGAPLIEIVRLVGARWLMHWSPDFLFMRGDRFNVLNPAGFGALAWWMLPGLAAAVALVIARAPRRDAERLVLLLLLLYPVGDLVSTNDGVHSLRSSAGLPALVLAAGLGTAWLVTALRRSSRYAGRAAAALLVLAALVESVRFGRAFFVTAPRSRDIQLAYQVALLDASRLLRPMLPGAQAVFCTTTAMNEPFVIVLMGTGYDPQRWLDDKKERLEGAFDRYRRVGPFRFIYDDQGARDLAALDANGRPDTVLFVVRPNEFGLTDPKLTLRTPAGEPVLWIAEQVH